jgi:UDP-glucose 4-epimerase
VEHFIFSSTAAVYGIPEQPLVSEDTATAPINAYGQSKLMSEMMLRDLGMAFGGRALLEETIKEMVDAIKR